MTERSFRSFLLKTTSKIVSNYLNYLINFVLYMLDYFSSLGYLSEK